MYQRGAFGIYLLFVFTLSSCHLIESTPVLEDLFEKEVKRIDWNSVDELPTIEPCLIFKSKAMKKECFFSIISDSIYTKLIKKSDFSIYTKIDTVRLTVIVTADSQLKFRTSFSANDSPYECEKIDSIIGSKLVDFPKVYPAIKKGFPVTSQFVIPVVLLPSRK